MKKLYDEIMSIPVPNLGDDRYIDGMNNALEKAAEMAKKYDDEIDRLNEIIEYLIGRVNELYKK